VRIERDGRRLVIDPGMFSDLTVLEGAEAVLISHEHPDHVAIDAVAAALKASARLSARGPAGVAAQLIAAGAPADRVFPAAAGDTVQVAGFEVHVLGGTHAVIHPALPGTENLAYLVEDIALHPGDSFTATPAGASVKVLLLPVSAPWLKLADATDYAQRVAPAIVVPVHDAILSDAGRSLTDRAAGALVAPATYRRLATGDTLEV
jgi:L-ascorbate metabolism protein UlaG (beta-lactamase superfamily)